MTTNKLFIWFLVAGGTSCAFSDHAGAQDSTSNPVADPPAPWKQWLPNQTPPPGTPNAGGANWVVNSPPGYGALKGTFSRTGKMGLNPANVNKPTFYLGATGGGFEIDAGAQYEPKPKDRLPPGWSVVMSLNVSGYHLWDQPSLPANRSIDVGYVPSEFKVTANGVATLTMGNFPPLENRISVVPGWHVNTSTIRMKRVIGITQPLGFKEDGSYMLGTTFSASQLDVFGDDAMGRPDLRPTYNWPLNDSVWAYKPSASSGKNRAGRWYINMQSPWQRTSSGAQQEAGVHWPNRYWYETVDIDLGGAAQLKKFPLKGAKPIQTTPR